MKGFALRKKPHLRHVAHGLDPLTGGVEGEALYKKTSPNFGSVALPGRREKRYSLRMACQGVVLRIMMPRVLLLASAGMVHELSTSTIWRPW
jgi:hypothetical protein